MRTKHFWAGLILFLILLNSCEKEKNVEFERFSISYSKVSSWVDYSYVATIEHNGLLQVSEVSGLTIRNRNSVYHLSDKDLKLIKEKLSNVITTDISDMYGFDNENAPTDLPAIKLIYKTEIKEDSTCIYFPEDDELPVQFDSFLQSVEQVILDYDSLINCF